MLKNIFICLSIIVLLVGCGRPRYASLPFYKTPVNPKGFFLDTRTGLTWQDNTRPPLYSSSWSSAVSYCGRQTIGGFKDWRLPSINELVTLIDYDKTSKSINTRAYKYSIRTIIIDEFKGLYGLPGISPYFISSTQNSKGEVLKVSYQNGSLFSEKKSSNKTSRVLCVRGEKKPIYLKQK